MEFERMLAYSAGLAANNERSWFHANHKQYEQARADFLDLLECMRFALIREIPALENDLLYMPAKSWTYRTARDMRIHRDRPPYNPAFRAYLSPDKRSWLPLGYFMRIFPGSSYFGTGLWCEDRATVNGIREFIRDNWMELDWLLEQAGLTLQGHQAVKTAPRGFDPDHPAIAWLRQDSWSVGVDIPDEELTDFQPFADQLAAQAARMEPIRQYFLRAARYAQANKPKLK